ncbi:putative protein phosphatase 2C 8 [Cinnamomum micranthum f. kanehirae]|uniref:PPM-type phosphatase domain-containing protein n=1 Tax=Cinnamomum micranthum f. kanehirae TaxID=337451 RepID=A0A3S3N1B1_9MAGN|nr:putative protein phosphatase 2C 8 [Cinnamomum micranthum f. kanehirae]
MMSGSFLSGTMNEVSNGTTHHKREGNLVDEDSVSKKSKVSSLVTESAEKPGGNPDCCVSERSQTVLDEIDSKKCNNFQKEVSKEEVKEDQIHDHSISSEDKIFIEADVAEDKGSRHTMEDAWVLLPEAGLEFPGKLRCAHFAIYDGHGGRSAADYARHHLHLNVLSAGLPRELMDIKAAKKAILEGFRRTDEGLLQESATGGWQDGATAVCVWLLGQTVLVANIGDAKAVLARSSSANEDGTSCTLKSIVITREHKAIFPQERARIQKAGGSIGSNGRLQGRLEVSRAFGDRQFKKVGVIATPDIQSFELTEREHFMILGCDGLWGVFGPSDAVDFVDKQLKDGLSVTAVSRRLVREAVRERRCKDNCTAIVIVFRRNK